MAIPAELKLDVRVRERLVSDGLLAESEVQSHLDVLPDLDGQAVELTIKQPALQNESDRDIVIVRTSGVRPPVAPIRPADEDMPIIDDDDDDEDLDPKKPEAKKPVEKPKAAAPKAEESDVEDDDDDDDDDEDDEAEEADGEPKVDDAGNDAGKVGGEEP